MSGTFELKPSTDKFMFNLKASNGQVILTSQRYASKASAVKGIASVRTNAPLDEHYERNTASDGKPYFNLKASNGQVIGTSERYSSASAMEKGIASVKANAPEAKLNDLTMA